MERLVYTYNDPPVFDRTFASFNEYYNAKEDLWRDVDAVRAGTDNATLVTWECGALNRRDEFGDTVSGHRDFMRAVRDAGHMMDSHVLTEFFSGRMDAPSHVTFRVYEGTDATSRISPAVLARRYF